MSQRRTTSGLKNERTVKDGIIEALYLDKTIQNS